MIQKHLYILLNVIEAFYVFYMMNYFRTTYSVHLPFENITKKHNFLIHPINTNKYESKICPLGNLIGYLIPLWIAFRVLFNNSVLIANINIIIWILIFVLSFIMNVNAFIYFIPAFVIEACILIKHN